MHARGKTSGKLKMQNADERRFRALVLIAYFLFTRFPQNQEAAKLRRIQGFT
jgi:hypothetical protein